MAAALDWEPDQGYFAVLAEKFQQSFTNADPFPHVVIDDFLPEPVIEDILAQLTQYPTKTRLSLTGPMIVARVTPIDSSRSYVLRASCWNVNW